MRFCDDCADKNTENILSNCKKIRSSVDETFKDYTVLKELGASLFRKDAETILNSDEIYDLLFFLQYLIFPLILHLFLELIYNLYQE